MKIRKYAQSTLLLTSNSGSTLLIDPGNYNLDPGRLTAKDFPVADAVVVTHRHADHFSPDILKSILTRKSCKIVTNSEVKDLLSKEGIDATSMVPGDRMNLAGFEITAIQTDHVQRGEIVSCFGLVARADSASVYDMSDTRYMEPSLLPPETKADCLLIPINDRGVSMGIDDALVFAGELKPKIVIPIHYDSPKDRNRVDPHEFASKAKTIGLNPKVLAFGEEFAL